MPSLIPKRPRPVCVVALSRLALFMDAQRWDESVARGHPARNEPSQGPQHRSRRTAATVRRGDEGERLLCRCAQAAWDRPRLSRAGACIAKAGEPECGTSCPCRRAARARWAGPRHRSRMSALLASVFRAAPALRPAGTGGLFGGLLATTVAAGAGANPAVAGGLGRGIGGVHGESPFG